GLVDMDVVFVTHFHADHWLGLPGMLKSFALREREQPLTVYGPRGLTELMGLMRGVYGRLPYRLEIVELEPAQTVAREGYLIAAIPVSHRAQSSFGYALVEEPRPGHLDAQLAEQLGVRPGPDFGRLQRGETVGGVAPEQVMGPTREGRKIVLSGDTEPCEALAIAAHQADLLVHEATFAEEESERARQTAHSTARQAGEVARDAEARLLALTHISTRYAGGELRDEARAVFPATEAPRDFDTIEVPFPERGAATLLRWSERQARERAGGEVPAQAAEADSEASERIAAP
ncbi:MAG TPA: MBL fold metallo-hydrolase, partial [Solirubrobacteraceae bacterium]|nr:MBL fold metallo-hydrolase [Solirubrobacteraceae bacterium]